MVNHMRKNVILLILIIFAATCATVSADNTVVTNGSDYNYSNKGDAYYDAQSEYEYDFDSDVVEPAEPGLILQGGDGIADAFVINSLPFDDTGSTSGYTSDWDPICCDGCMYGPDVVYSFTPTNTIKVNVNTCGSDFYDVLYVFKNSPDTIVACNSWFDVCPPHSALERLSLRADNTYYFVVDGYWTSEGYYELHIREHLSIECPPEALLEDEPDCGDGYIDVYNGGCNSPEDPKYSDIRIGDIICGESGTFVTDSTNYRDSDWFRLELTESKLLHWYVTAEFPVQAFIFDAEDENCDNIKSVIQGQTTTNDTIHIAYNAVPGVYYFYVSPLFFQGYSCPLTYLAWLEAEDPPAIPTNDNCVDVTPVYMTTADTLVFDGTTVGATRDCPGLDGYAEVWEAFEFDVMSDVKIEYCGTDPIFNRCYVALVDGCPYEGRIMYSMYNRDDCGDGNVSINWYDLPAGTYYYPVLSQWETSYDFYHITVTSTSIYPGIDVSHDEIIDEAEPGEQTTFEFEFSNIGYDVLTFEIYPDQDQPSPEWLSADIASGSLPVGDSVVTVTLTMDADSLAEGTYTGTLILVSNSADSPILDIPITFEVGPSGYAYIPGDANMLAGTWPPTTIGADVTYLVNYFRAIAQPCLIDGFFAAGDANGDCSVIGADVTFLVQYFRGANELQFCADYPPMWPPLPEDEPAGWPPCE